MTRAPLPASILTALAAATLATAALAGCTVTPVGQPPLQKPTVEKQPAVAHPAAADTEPLDGTVDPEQQYDDTVASFLRTLPAGYAFPNSTQIDLRGNGAVAAYTFWRCAVAQAARDAEVEDSDYAAGAELLSQITSVSDTELPGNSAWVDDVIETAQHHTFNAALEGETGVCYSWLTPYGRWGDD